MLRLIGCGGILVGALGLFWEWRGQEKREIAQLEELEFFLQKGAFSIEKELKQSRIFFREYMERDAKNPLFQEILHITIENLNSNTFPTGKEAWAKAWEAKKREWRASEDEWKVIMDMGEAFFGRNRIEMSRQMKAYEERIREFKSFRRKQMKEKGKIYMPLSISGGFLIILLLI